MRKLIALVLTLALVLAAVPALAEGKLVVLTPNPDAEITHILNPFAEKYGNRDDEFYYSTVGDIFDYEDAIADLTVTDEKIVNGSQLTLYIKVDGNPVVLAPESEYVLE